MSSQPKSVQPHVYFQRGKGRKNYIVLSRGAMIPYPIVDIREKGFRLELQTGTNYVWHAVDDSGSPPSTLAECQGREFVSYVWSEPDDNPTELAHTRWVAVKKATRAFSASTFESIMEKQNRECINGQMQPILPEAYFEQRMQQNTRKRKVDDGDEGDHADSPARGRARFGGDPLPWDWVAHVQSPAWAFSLSHFSTQAYDLEFRRFRRSLQRHPACSTSLACLSKLETMIRTNPKHPAHTFLTTNPLITATSAEQVVQELKKKELGKPALAVYSVIKDALEL